MSKFYSSAGFKNFGKNDSIPITTKVSKNQLKKQQKASKQNTNSQSVSLGITDEEFDKMMEENDLENDLENNLENKNVVKTNDSRKSSNLYQVPENYNSEKTNELISSGLEGNELVNHIKHLNNISEGDSNKKITGLDLIKGLIEKFNKPEYFDWVIPNKYGLALKYLFESNRTDQIICLLMLENFAKTSGFIKVSYKNSQVYHIRLLFQLFFTYEIIDEDAFYEWQDYLEKNTQYDEKTINMLAVQTTEFFMILKTVFDDEEDKEDVDVDKDDNANSNKSPLSNPNKQQNLNNNTNNNGSESESDSENDMYKVPEEQDYNLDDL